MQSTTTTGATAASAGLPPSAPKKTDLWIRLLSSLALAPLAIWLVWLGSWPLALLTLLVLVIGACEWNWLSAPKPVPLSLQAVSIATLGLTLAAIFIDELAIAGLVLCLSILPMWLLARRAGCRLAPLTAMGPAYLGLSLICFLWLRGMPDDPIGRGQVFFILFLVWAVDTGAYFAGRAIGGPKLAPKLSPKKTWAGLVGGMIAAAVIGTIWARFAGARLPELALILGPILAVIAQIGDISESAMKRHFGAKDSGNIIPGHGGVLDRIDGLLLAIPVFTAFQQTLGKIIAWW